MFRVGGDDMPGGPNSLMKIMRIYRSDGGVFTQDRPLGVYLQLYNVGLDQSSLAPALAISYKIIKDGQTIVEVKEESGESVQYFSGQRVVLIKTSRTAPGP